MGQAHPHGVACRVCDSQLPVGAAGRPLLAAHLTADPRAAALSGRSRCYFQEREPFLRRAWRQFCGGRRMPLAREDCIAIRIGQLDLTAGRVRRVSEVLPMQSSRLQRAGLGRKVGIEEIEQQRKGRNGQRRARRDEKQFVAAARQLPTRQLSAMRPTAPR
jgi:hypothetical protein